MNPYKLIIFDWEGTLSDKSGLALVQLSILTKEMGLKPFDKKKARQLLHLGFYDLLSVLYGDVLASHQILGLKDKFRQYQYRHIEEVCLFHGVKKLLKSLKAKGILLGIATGKGRDGLKHDLKTSGIFEYFFETRTPNDCRGKPAPDMLEEMMVCAGVGARETLMIGDTVCDLETAKNASVDCFILDVDRQLEKKEMLAQGAACVLYSYAALYKKLLP